MKNTAGSINYNPNGRGVPAVFSGEGMPNMLTGRFAPSPSGRMHLGNVFSALLAWLSVRSRNGRMLLRIEDLDPDRCRPDYIETLKRDLDWLGLDWDEEQTPQSMRADAYHAEFERLRALGLVYPCYCSRAELHAASAPHASDGNVIYAGTCRSLTEAERAAKTRAPAWRVIVPDTSITVQDGLQGAYTENLARDCGDFIIRRSDGVYAYQLAVVTDDAAGGVTDCPGPGSVKLRAAPDVAAKDARISNACVLPCAAAACAGRTAAEQAGKIAGPRSAAGALHAGAAGRNACVPCRPSARTCACCTCRAGIWICVEKRPIRQCRYSFRIWMRYIINGIS